MRSLRAGGRNVNTNVSAAEIRDEAGQSHLKTGAPFVGRFPAKSNKMSEDFGVFTLMFVFCSI